MRLHKCKNLLFQKRAGSNNMLTGLMLSVLLLHVGSLPHVTPAISHVLQTIQTIAAKYVSLTFMHGRSASRFCTE